MHESRVVKDRKCWTCGEVFPTTARGIETHGKVCVPARPPLLEGASGARDEVHKAESAPKGPGEVEAPVEPGKVEGDDEAA